MELKIVKLEEAKDAIVAALEGPIDRATHAALTVVLDDLRTKAAPRTIIDLSGVPRIDSVGLGSLLALAEDLAEKKGRLLLVGVKPAVRKLMEIVGFAPHFSFYPDVASALAG